MRNEDGSRAKDVLIDDHQLHVALMDGRTVSVPLAIYPRLANATVKERQAWEIAGGGDGVHWPAIDEDLNTEGLLREGGGRASGRVY